ncbi:hypothetical protein PL81_06665 [Streptomyces sp. RSD-27]|nr:hypothetical protein PL81_06665 [Streptomyces sp. RSD-27]
MSHHPQDDASTPTPDQLREQVRHTRDELGRTVEALAYKADVKEQAKDKAVEVKERAAGAAALVTDQLRSKAAQASELVKEKTPDPVLDKAASATAMARANRAALVAAAAVVIVLLLRHNRRRK